MSNIQGRYKRKNWDIIDGAGDLSGSTGTIVSRIRPRGKAGPGGWSPRIKQIRQGKYSRRWS